MVISQCTRSQRPMKHYLSLLMATFHTNCAACIDLCCWDEHVSGKNSCLKMYSFFGATSMFEVGVHHQLFDFVDIELQMIADAFKLSVSQNMDHMNCSSYTSQSFFIQLNNPATSTTQYELLIHSSTDSGQYVFTHIR